MSMKGVVLVLLSLASLAECLQLKVCQNKSCCKGWKHSTPLPEVLRDLLGPDVAIESTGCLGQCQHGPNICLKQKNELIMHDIVNPTTAAAHLEALASIKVPSKLLAAVNVLEKAKQDYQLIGAICSQDECQGTALGFLFDGVTREVWIYDTLFSHAMRLLAEKVEEKERFVSSIIKALESDFGTSTALARALIYRAKVHVSKKQLFEAETDAMNALDILAPSEKRLVYKATSVLADVFELQGNIQEAANLLQDLADNDRSMRSKLVKEVERLRNLGTAVAH